MCAAIRQSPCCLEQPPVYAASARHTTNVVAALAVGHGMPHAGTARIQVADSYAVECVQPTTPYCVLPKASYTILAWVLLPGNQL